MSLVHARTPAQDEAARASFLSEFNFPSGAMCPSSVQLAYNLKGNETTTVYVVLQSALVINSHLASGSVVSAPTPLVACIPFGLQTRLHQFAATQGARVLAAAGLPQTLPAQGEMPSLSPLARFAHVQGDLIQSADPTDRLVPNAKTQEEQYFGLQFARAQRDRIQSIEPAQRLPWIASTQEGSLFDSPISLLKSVLQQLGLTYIELSEVLGVSRQTIHQWMKSPNVHIRDINERNIRALAAIGAEWHRRVGDQPIPQWCWGSALVADGRLVDHLKASIHGGQGVDAVLSQIEKYVRRDDAARQRVASLKHVPMPLSDQELAIQALSRKNEAGD